MKTADLMFVDNSNCAEFGISQKFIDKSTMCFFRLRGCGDEELLNILNYRSWVLKSWKYGIERKYFVFKWTDLGDLDKVVWCYSGFSSLLIRYLQNNLGYLVNGKEMFRAKEIKLGEMKHELWDFQREAVRVWMDSGCYGIIKAPTGSGKSIIGCRIIKEMGAKTIVCVHTSDLLVSVWFNRLIEEFGDSIRGKIGIIGGGLSKKDRKMLRVCGDNFSENIEKDIVLATSQSLLNKLVEIGKERWGLLLVDEIHRYPAEHFKKVTNAIRAQNRLGLSGTLIRPDGMSPMMHGLIGSVVYRVSIKELVNKGFLVEPIFSSVVVSDKKCEDLINNSDLKLLEFSRYVKKVSASSMNKFNYIMELCNSLKINGKKFLVYTDFVNHNIDDSGIVVHTRDDYVNGLLSAGIKVLGISADFSSNERERIFHMMRKGKLDGIVFGSLGIEGVDIPSVDSVIMCNSTASTIKFPQAIGRGMRISPGKKNCFVYEVLLNVDKELSWSKENFYEYVTEGYEKDIIYVDEYGKVVKKEMYSM